MQFCEDIDIIDDDLCEFTETFLLNGGSVGPGTIIANSPLMATIIDNDGKLVGHFSIIIYSAFDSYMTLIGG